MVAVAMVRCQRVGGAGGRRWVTRVLGCALCGLAACGGLGYGSPRGELNFVGQGRLQHRPADWRGARMGARPQKTARQFQGGRGGPPMQEPSWLGTAFLALIVLSFIPGPWQIILGPIISIINLFYMFKFGIFLFSIAAIFGLSWWFENTTAEGQCPRCSCIQRAPKGEPFDCINCGENLEVKDGVFVRYVKSGNVQGSAFDQLKDMAQEAAAKASKAATAKAADTGKSSKNRKPRKDVEVVDVEVL